MHEYDYGNARLKAMKSRLLTGREVNSLVNAGNVEGLITALAKTVYKSSVESALTRSSGIDCIDDALRDNLENTVGKINHYYDGKASKLVAIILRVYDINNVKAILRGLSKKIDAKEIFRSLLPVGQLRFNLLRQLVRLGSPREVIDALVSMSQPIAKPLIALRVEHPGAKLIEFELALDKWHYQDALNYLTSKKQTEEILNDALSLDADLTNILTALRFVGEPAAFNQLQDILNDENVEHLFIGPGRIPFTLLAEASRQKNVTAAIEILLGTTLATPLKDGLKHYAQSQRISDIEDRLKRYRLKWMANQLVKDALGIGVVLGYVALKTSEVSNICYIARGIELGLSVDDIWGELE